MAYTSRLLNAIPGIRHAFLDVHETVAFPYAELAPVKLVHGNEVHHYQQPLPTRPHADAVFTAVAGQKVGVVTADCLPLLIASRDGRYVCSVHAGWQGLVSGIVDNSLACFRQQGVALADLVIAVGPYIHPCCYEVSAGFYQQLLDQPGGDRVARHRQRLFHSRSGPVSDPLKAAARGSDNLWFDLRAFAEAIFAEAGWRRRALNGWGVVPTAPRSRWAPTGAGPIFRRRRAFSIRGSCAKPEAGSR